MPDHDETTQHSEPAAGTGEHQRMSRRSLLRGASAAGAAGVAATALAGLAGPALASTRPRGEESGLRDDETADEVVVHVKNARSGEIDVFRGTEHVRVTDRALAARLVRASR
jgi:hypothetical protein